MFINANKKRDYRVSFFMLNTVLNLVLNLVYNDTRINEVYVRELFHQSALTLLMQLHYHALQYQ
jgi:hypothetical protein